MGIRIHRNTWSAPLQLIDSWLPASRPTPLRPLSLVTQRFVRAGWLHRHASNDESHARPVTATQAEQKRVARVTPDSRVVLSGRLTDVCAELERLAEQENRHMSAAA